MKSGFLCPDDTPRSRKARLPPNLDIYHYRMLDASKSKSSKSSKQIFAKVNRPTSSSSNPYNICIPVSVQSLFDSCRSAASASAIVVAAAAISPRRPFNVRTLFSESDNEDLPPTAIQNLGCSIVNLHVNELINSTSVTENVLPVGGNENLDVSELNATPTSNLFENSDSVNVNLVCVRTDNLAAPQKPKQDSQSWASFFSRKPSNAGRYITTNYEIGDGLVPPIELIDAVKLFWNSEVLRLWNSEVLRLWNYE